MDYAEEHRILEENRIKALEEASQKTKDALSLEGLSPRDLRITVWKAMEVVEYTSFLFAVTFDFEDVDPATPPTKGMDLPSLMKESARIIEVVKSSPSNDKLADYTRIRDAVHYLRTAYLEITKRPSRKRQNLTRSKPGRTSSQGGPRVSVGHVSCRRSRRRTVPQRTHPSNTT